MAVKSTTENQLLLIITIITNYYDYFLRNQYYLYINCN